MMWSVYKGQAIPFSQNVFPQSCSQSYESFAFDLTEKFLERKISTHCLPNPSFHHSLKSGFSPHSSIATLHSRLRSVTSQMLDIVGVEVLVLFYSSAAGI